MNLDSHSESFIRSQMASGRFSAPEEVVREGLRLFEEQEKKLQALREHIDKAAESKEWYTADEVMTRLEKSLREKFPQ